jgi:NDP-sugar pyrophosphorylase family protein
LESCIPYLETQYEEILPSIWVAKGVRIHGTSTLRGPLVLGQGVEIGQEVVLQGPVYLGNWTRLEEGVEIRSSLLCEGVIVGTESTVLDSILGKGVVLEDRVTIRTQGKGTGPLSVEFPRGVSHPTGCHRLGSYLCPGVKVLKGTCLEPGTFLVST